VKSPNAKEEITLKSEILKLLKSTNEYVSGQELCEKFGVSRTAIWKAIEGLKKDGYEIEAVRNRGYKLAENGSDVFCQRELSSQIAGISLIKEAVFFEEIGSTNTEAKRRAEEGTGEGLLLVADRQTAGKGRRGRSWISPAGKNAYYTLLLRPDISPEKAPMLTLVMALSVASALEDMYNGGVRDEIKAAFGVTSAEERSVKIKWPNDVLIGGRKICGILTEMSAENDYIQYVVIGVGLNIKPQEFAEEIADKATSIDTQWGITTKRCKLVADIMRYFEKYYKEFLRGECLGGLKSKYESFLINKGRGVLVLDPKGEYTGKALGINDGGELIVKKENGETVEVYAGEVSVRGIYGYT